MATSSSRRPRIARMAEPLPSDQRKALVVAAYMAREALSEAERAVGMTDKPSYDVILSRTNDADKYLSTVDSMLAEQVDPEERAEADKHLRRTRAAIKAACGHGRLAKSYTTTGSSAFEAKVAVRSRIHWLRATEHARQECHRLLTELAELFPGAYETEEA